MAGAACVALANHGIFMATTYTISDLAREFDLTTRAMYQAIGCISIS